MATKETKEKNMSDNATNVKVLLLSEIAVPYDWNSRSKESVLVEGAGDDGSEDGGTDGISASIEARGQDTPVHVRLNPNKRDAQKHPYELIAGFKRFEAMTRLSKRGLANKNNHPIAVDPSWDATKPTIRATVDDVTETGACAVNLRENMARGNLTSADTCFALMRYINLRTKELGKEPTDSAVAAEMGTTQGYVSKLHRIHDAFSKAPRGAEVLAHWRMSRKPLGVDEMLRVIKVDPARLHEEYTGSTGKKTEETGEKDPNAWMVGAQKEAEDIGRLFGIAQYHAQMKEGEQILWGEIIKDMMKIKSTASPEQVKEIGKSARTGFFAGLKEVPDAKAKAEAEKADKLAKKAAAKDAADDKKAAKGAASANGAKETAQA